MVRARKRGERLPDNYVKIAILLFIGDDKKAQFEIKEYLKQVHISKTSTWNCRTKRNPSSFIQIMSRGIFTRGI